MKCIVTGAAGFIGSHLCERLLKEGHSVIGIDDLSSGSLNNLSTFRDHKNFHFIQLDITSEALEIPHGIFYKTDWMFHLAAKADVVPSIENPTLYHHVNVTGTVRVLQAARKLGVKRFIYAASSSCYGIPRRFPTGENCRPEPMYPYALTKYLGEQCVFHWAKVYKIPAVSLRLFNVYGPRSRTSGTYGAVFGVFLSQLANHQPLTVVGNGRQSRDFTYVTDVVEAFVLAAQSQHVNETYNIGSGKPRTVKELVALLGNPKTITVPDRPGEPRKTHARNSRAARWLNWHPKVSFEEGVEVMKTLISNYSSAPLWTKDSIAVATESWFKHLGQ